MTANDVIHFWFEEIAQESWWKKDEAFDKEITERFLYPSTDKPGSPLN